MSNSNPAQTTREATPAPQRRRRPSTGGFALKLDAEQRPGFTRRFVNGDPMRIKAMEDLGYSIVSGPGEGKSRTESMGSTISRHAGTDTQGKPFQAVLMETPNDLYAQGEAEKEEGRAAFEETIRRGAKTQDTPEGAYLPSRSTITHSG
jgi:hypothetical protein